MINLACKNISVEELIRCAFNLKKTEYQIIRILLKHPGLTSHELSQKLEKDVTTIQKSLKILSQEGLVLRKQRNLEQGGYEFYYESIPKNKIKENIEINLKNFEDKVLDAIRNF